MPEIGFRGFTAGSSVALSVAQGAASAGNSVAGWGASVATFSISTLGAGPAVAPYGLWFTLDSMTNFPVSTLPDATTNYVEAFHKITWVWDFGDAANATPTTPLNMPDVWKNLNVAYGFQAFHVFNDPGTYTVTCKGYYQGQLIAEETAEIVIGDPDLVFPGARTIAVSQVGDFTGAPTDSDWRISFPDALAALRGLGASGRILLRAGERFTGVKETIDGRYRNLRIGAFGDGDKPILEPAIPAYSETVRAFDFKGVDAPNNVTFYGVRFEGGWDARYEVGRNRQKPWRFGFWETPEWMFVAHRCEVSGLEMIEANPFSDRGSAHTFVLNDCLVTNWRDYGLFGRDHIGPGRLAIVGSSIAQHPGAARGNGKIQMGNEHGPLRHSETQQCIFSVVDTFSNTSWAGRSAQPGIRNATNAGTELKVVVDRHTHEGGQGYVSTGLSGTTELPSNQVVDKFFYVGTSFGNVFVKLGAGGTTVRNGLMVQPDVPHVSGTGNNHAFLEAAPSGANSNNENAPVDVYNCTAVNLGNSSANFVKDRGFDVFNRETIENNLYYAPDQPTPYDDGPIDLSTPIAGFVPRYQGGRESIEKPTVTLLDTVSAGGSLVFPYPAGYSGDNFRTVNARHVVKVDSWFFYVQDGDVGVSMDQAGVTVTNLSGVDWPLGATCRLGLELTSESYAAQLDTSLANPASIPLCRPLTGSSAIGSATPLSLAFDDILTIRREGELTQGALKSVPD